SVAQKAGQETYQKAAETAGSLIQDEDYVVDIIEKTIFLTKAGSEKIYRQFESPRQTNSSYRSLRDINQELDRVQKLSQDCQNEPTLLRPWHEYVESALRANHIMTKDVHYVVRDDRIEIVDEYTGRIFSDRNWRDGLHQAVEVKECVKVTDEKRTIGRISRQRYFQRYDLLCGMTGTIVGHEREMLTAYDLPIVVIPLKKKSQRTELATRYFSCQQSKNDAIELDVASRQKKGQPVLIGTRTIEQTIMLAKCLTKQGIHHDVLNGVQDKAESELISRAGRSGSVVIATNMAGRGTDIKLDERALAAGGLHVIGYERNRSKRIDLQLLGRAGRQGDPGSGQFFVSATDEIVTRYDRSFQKTLARLKGRLDGATNRNFDNRVRRIQQKAERESREQRDSVMREELWLDEVRKAVSNS
ncbi:MAG: helicase-related protein, partial [Planctomycetota bacterium]